VGGAEHHKLRREVSLHANSDETVAQVCGDTVGAARRAYNVPRADEFSVGLSRRGPARLCSDLAMSFVSEQAFEADDGSDEVELLLAQCLERAPQERSARLDELCTRHPTQSGELRRRWGLLASMGLVDDAPADVDEFPAELGDFALQRRLGGGGMGVVFLARQRSLSREVALKLIRADQLYFPRVRERFRREAEAVARLAHPGVVPIYQVGEERGVPFYAMEHVAGATLAKLLETLAARAPDTLHGADLLAALRRELGDDFAPPADSLFEVSWTEACVRIARDVADALEHSHERGVLHRDIKPSNVMLTRDGRARLIDFGLTLLEGDSAQTRTGAQLGTLPYMAPEQVRGERLLDGRVDVYGLGVTLYELLALQLPFRGADAVQLQAAILEGRPPPIRARNRRVGAELETVCLVALERDVARRYASAASLRDDLDRLLARQPIRVRAAGPFVRTLRFAERRPGLVAALAAGLLVAVAAPTAFLLREQAHASELGDALEKERAARGEAERERAVAAAAEASATRERAKAETAAATASGALDFVFELFTSASPEFTLGADTTALALLEQGARRVESDTDLDPAARARIEAGIGRVLGKLGRHREARPLLERARTHFAGLDGPPSEVARELDEVLGLSYVQLGEFELARPVVERAIAQARASESDDALVDALSLQATLQGTLSEWEAASATTREVLALLERSNVPERERRIASTLTLLAQLHMQRQERPEARACLERALALQRQLLPAVHPDLFDTVGVAALLAKLEQRPAEASVLYEEADCLARELRLDRGSAYANLLHNWAMLLVEQRDFDRALVLLARAQDVDRESSGAVGHVGRIAAYGRGRALVSAGRFAEALDALGEAARLFEGREELEARWNFGGILMRTGHCHIKLRQYEAARCALDHALEILTAIPRAEFDIGQSLLWLADAYEGLGQLALAREQLERALQVVESAPSQAKNVAGVRKRLTDFLARHALDAER
jgi:serine/threonine protein kinase